jgi:hypothetical protein
MKIQKQYTEKEIEEVLMTQNFKHVYVPAFKFPEEIKNVKSPYTWYKSYVQFAAPLLALPAFIFVFAFLFNGNSSSNIVKNDDKNLAMLEESNARLISQIEDLENLDK